MIVTAVGFIALCQNTEYITAFTPEKLGFDNYLEYLNTPLSDNSEIHVPAAEVNDYVLEVAMTTGSPPGNDAILGIALYRNYMRGFKRVVGSLRHFGYNGHIILGVHPAISSAELEYLRSRQVTAYAVNVSTCNMIATEKGKPPSLMRGKCTEELPNLKVEWGRFELARRWLRACNQCTGWNMVIDVRDIYFQDHPVSGFLVCIVV